MENINFFGVIILIVGIISLIRVARSYSNNEYLRNYIETSPKAIIWRNKFGVEKAMDITKKVFLPIGLVVSLALISFGAYTTAVSLNLL